MGYGAGVANLLSQHLTAADGASNLGLTAEFAARNCESLSQSDVFGPYSTELDLATFLACLAWDLKSPDAVYRLPNSHRSQHSVDNRAE